MPPKTRKDPKSTPTLTASAGPSPAKEEKPVKLPKSFIVRPNGQDTPKKVFEIYLTRQVLNTLGPASFFHLSRDSEPGVLVVAKEMPSSALGHNIVLISRSLRKLLRLSLGDRVSVTPSDEMPEIAVSVSVATDITADTNRIKRAVTEMGILCCGLQIRVGEATVIVTKAEGIPDVSGLSVNDETASGVKTVAPMFVCSSSTDISVTPELPQTDPTGFVHIGGLASEISLLRTLIDVPLNRPQLFADFGISPPRGILLTGPSGTGKSLLLSAIAAEYPDAHIVRVSGPAIVSKYLGETEATLRSLFEEARKFEPSLLLMDEIDSLAPKREADDSGEAEQRVVATLFTLMDSIPEQSRVVLVGATNRPNKLDAGLRRPGRFDREVEIGIPDAAARTDIVEKLLGRMRRHKLESKAAEIGSRTHGFVGADLAALCREAVMQAIRRGEQNQQNQHNPDGNSESSFDDVFVEWRDVTSALQSVRPSAMREIFVETPKVRWEDIGGQEEVKQKLREMVQLPLEAAETFQRLGVQAPKGVLLYGPPGCSKTLIAKALATESGVNFLAVKGPEIFNKYVGESERAVREVFRKARAAAPSIVFFDEIDALSGDRGGDHATTTSDSVLTSLLNEIDGVEELRGVVVVAATNRPDVIDAALLRPGRLDRHIYVAPPGAEDRKQIFRNQWRRMRVAEGVREQIDTLAQWTEGCSGAEVVLLCQEAGLAAIKEDVGISEVEWRHFEEAGRGIQRGITREMLEFYEAYSEGKR